METHIKYNVLSLQNQTATKQQFGKSIMKYTSKLELAHACKVCSRTAFLCTMISNCYTAAKANVFNLTLTRSG
jgi:hypothetical protein